MFSEIHLNELKKLEKQLETADSEKGALTSHLRESQAAAERSEAELQALQNRVLQLSAHVDALQSLQRKGGALGSILGGRQANGNSVEEMAASLAGYQGWFSLLANEVC